MQDTTILGASDEVDFWRVFVHTQQFKTWLDDSYPTPELDPAVVEHIQREKEGKVLDVGSGVVSILRGTVIPTSRLYAADLLSREYEKFFPYNTLGILPPLSCSAEALNFDSEFQVVHMRNALDHCQNPAKAFRNLTRAVKTNGLLIIGGFLNEGDYLHGLGMHQWNIGLNGAYPYIRSIHKEDPALKLDFSQLRPLLSMTTTLSSQRQWITWIARKL